MPRVVFMCGPAGAGKSTVARRLEDEGMVRLSLDQEAWARGHRAMPLPDAVRDELHLLVRDRLVELVGGGRDVVLDLSFWSRDMRDRWRAVLASLDVVPHTIYLATDRETCLARLRDRATRHGDDFCLAPEIAQRYVDAFEPPSEDEGPLTVIR